MGILLDGYFPLHFFFKTKKAVLYTLQQILLFGYYSTFLFWNNTDILLNLSRKRILAHSGILLQVYFFLEF